MNSSKFKPVRAVKSHLPGSIITSTVNEDTGRRRFLGPETGLSRGVSRTNKTCHCVHHKSHQTPYPQLSEYAVKVSLSMTSKLKRRATSLLTEYLSTIAC